MRQAKLIGGMQEVDAFLLVRLSISKYLAIGFFSVPDIADLNLYVNWCVYV